MNKNRLQRFDGSLYVTGFMATGKSTLGKMLASETDLPYIDLDTYIEERENLSISEIFAQYGEPAFRNMEWQYLLELTRTYRGVVSLGGGALHDQRVVDHLKIHGLLIFIRTPLDDILERVMRNRKRPVRFDNNGKLKSRDVLFDDLKRLYSQRIAYYEQAQISIDGNNYSDTNKQVKDLLKKIEQHV